MCTVEVCEVFHDLASLYKGASTWARSHSGDDAGLSQGTCENLALQQYGRSGWLQRQGRGRPVRRPPASSTRRRSVGRLASAAVVAPGESRAAERALTFFF